MPLDPVTLTWEENEAPEPVLPPGSLPPPTLNYGQGSMASGAPPPPPVVATPTPTAAPTTPPPPPVGSPALQSGLLQPVEVTQTTSGSSVSGKVKSPEVNAAAGEQQAAGLQRIRASRAKAEAERKGAEAKLAKADLDAAVGQIQANDAKNVLAEADRRDREAQKVAGAKLQEYTGLASRKDETFLEGASTARKWAWGVGLLLGAFGAIKTGRNVAADLLSESIDSWSKQRADRLKGAWDAVKDAQGWKESAKKSYLESEMKSEPLKKAAALLQVSDEVQLELQKRRGQIEAEAEAEAQKWTADAKLEAAKLKLDFERDFAPTAESRGGALTQTTPAGTLHPRTVLDRSGKPLGLAPSDKEGAESRAALAQLAPIQGALDNMNELVAQTDWKDRVPVLGQWTDLQKRLKAQLDPILPMISQITGSGTPQAGEAKRLLDILTVGPSQSAEVTLQNIAEMKRTLDSAYDARARTLVPGAKTGTDNKPDTNAGGGVRKMVNGKPAMVYPDGTYEPL